MKVKNDSVKSYFFSDFYYIIPIVYIFWNNIKWYSYCAYVEFKKMILIFRAPSYRKKLKIINYKNVNGVYANNFLLFCILEIFKVYE